MKRFLLYLILTVPGMINAQIVDIPDSVFKNILLSSTSTNGIAKNSNNNSIAIDSNGDGEIQVSEALEVWDLNASDGLMSSLEGIEAFTNLRIIDCVECINMLSLDCTSLIHLEYLDIRNCQQLELLNLSGITTLEILYISGSSQITELDVENNINLNILSIQGCDNLETLHVSNLSNLEILACGHNNLTNLDLTGLASLKMLDCQANQNITQLDISDSPIIESLECHNTSITFLNLKNGGVSLIADNFVFVSYDDDPVYVCVDEDEVAFALAHDWGDVDVLINTYCSFTPGGDYNTISGTLTVDSDNNGCGGSDPASPLFKVSINDGANTGYTFTDLSGGYELYTQATGTFTLTPEFENDWFVATPASATVMVNTIDNSTTTQDFCITANGVHPDLAALIMPAATAQPGFDATYRIVYFNKGNQTISGSVFFSFDDARMDYVSASPAEDFTSGNIRGWNYTDLKPFESRNIFVTLNTNSPQETPAVNIGDILPFSVTVMPTTGDETPDDNQFLYDETVIGSFDPNDITCLEGEVAGPDMIGEYLHYNINFENTGDAAATFIVVKQVIDEEQFDITTLQPINTSHDVKIKVEGNIVEYRFDDIDLGPLEKGNIVFKIKSLNTLQVGDDVMQKAEIFFDYNWPIVTNEAVTVFEVLGTGDYEFDNTVKIYPNPVKDNLNITAGHDLKSIELYDLQGRLLQTILVKGTDATLNLSGRAAGVYFVKVTTEKGVKVEKIINE